MDKMLKILFKEPYKDCVLKEIPNDLKSIRNLIKCDTVESLTFPNKNHSYCILMDEDGKFKQLAGNFFIPEFTDCIVGNCVFANFDKNGNFKSLTEKQIEDIKKYTKYYGLNEGEDLYGDDKAYYIARAIKRYDRLRGEEL
ncbi:MAG: DUF3846 domain-containing protein [Anaeroplasma bactoclasticum]|nr:DUF3846 domain-containing protein [Anaeroplasma bactoclasticum]